MKNIKKTPRKISVLKEDAQSFELLVEEAGLEEAFSYPITSLPLSIAHPDGTLRQGNKSNFRNQLIKDCPSSKSEILPMAAWWINDGMALFRTVKSKNTYREWSNCVAKTAFLPALEYNAIQVEIVNDQYLRQSIKSEARDIRGDGKASHRVHISSVDQKMLSGKVWEAFFHNGENKEDLISLACSYYKSEKSPFSSIAVKKLWKITRGTIETSTRCNNEEADTRLIP